MASITITFPQDSENIYLLEMVKESIEDEYTNGGFDGYKPTIKIDEFD